MKNLSKKQREILKYIQKYRQERGFPPTLRDICKTFEIKSTNGARYHLHRLRKLGFIEIDEGKSRGVRMIDEKESPPTYNRRSYTLPVLGRIPAGPFNLASEELREDEVTVDPEFFAGRIDNPELFGLRVEGDSMVEAGIHEGDVVVVRAQQQANDGDIVVARLDDEATVKRFRRVMDEVILEPANSAYQPIYIKNRGGEEFGQNFALVGVVVGLIRAMG